MTEGGRPPGWRAWWMRVPLPDQKALGMTTLRQASTPFIRWGRCACSLGFPWHHRLHSWGRLPGSLAVSWLTVTLTRKF